MNSENVDSKTEFLLTLSHEIKNTLNIITAMCSMAGNHIDDKERALSYLDKICSMTERITAIIDRSLDISRWKKEEGCSYEEVFRICELKHELYELLYPAAEANGIVLRISTETLSDKEIIGDYGSLLQILINLATNSIKYTMEGGHVEIIIREDATEDTMFSDYSFICRDSGIGISEEFVDHIFEPFAREDDERVRRQKGTGLGMFIVKEAVEAMGGSIHIDSIIDKGTTVVVKLKLKKNMRKG